jgi:hypothetical protein
VRRRTFLTGSIAWFASGCATLSESEKAEVDRLGDFSMVRGQPGIVVAAPHGTTDLGSYATAQEVRELLGASGVFVKGFWLTGEGTRAPVQRAAGEKRIRINVNRPTEQSGGGVWYSGRAAHINDRYVALVREASQGPLNWFFEIHSSPYRPPVIYVDSGGISVAQAKQFKTQFSATLERLLPPEGPRFPTYVSPDDDVIRYASFQHSSTISQFARKGFLIEFPSFELGDGSPWRKAYAAALADAFLKLMQTTG